MALENSLNRSPKYQRARSLQLCGLGKLTEQVSEIQYLIYKLALTSTPQIWGSWEEGDRGGKLRFVCKCFEIWSSNPTPGHMSEKNIFQNYTCTPVFTAALFTIARTWKQPKCLSTKQWLKKMWYIYTMKYQSSEVTQSCPTLCDPMDYSLPGSSVHGISQARILESIAISFSRSSQPRDWTQVSHTAGRLSTVWATRKAPDELLLGH